MDAAKSLAMIATMPWVARFSFEVLQKPANAASSPGVAMRYGWPDGMMRAYRWQARIGDQRYGQTLQLEPGTDLEAALRRFLEAAKDTLFGYSEQQKGLEG